MRLPLLAFDMGNVLLPFDHNLACQRVADACDVEPADVYRAVIDSRLEEAFERGLLTPIEFTIEVSKRLNTSLDMSWLKAAWSDIFRADQEILELVAELQDHCELHLISNTNVWHFTHASAKFRILRYFEKRTLSYEVCAFKPDSKMFKYIADIVSSGRLAVYIDDIAHYVEAACAFGAKGYVFSSCDALRSHLNELNLL
jgi:FMN phosphatase YigB (HAD superfamily)